MICRIGSFELDAHSVEGVDERLTAPFATLERVENYPLYQSVGHTQEEIVIRGTYVKVEIQVMEWLKMQTKMKYPVRFTTERNSFLVVVEEIQTNKGTFIKGSHLFQEFTISMKRYYPESNANPIDIIGALL